MLIGSWAFSRPSKGDCGREKQSQREDEDLQRHIQPKKIVFKTNLKFCETKFSRGYIHLGHLLMSKSKMGKQRKRDGQKTDGHCKLKEASETCNGVSRMQLLRGSGPWE